MAGQEDGEDARSESITVRCLIVLLCLFLNINHRKPPESLKQDCDKI